MSHADYIAKCDEDQLRRLVEMAQAKLKQMSEAGWVNLWVVSDDSINYGWFAKEDYSKALSFLYREAGEVAAKRGAREFTVRMERYRPDEADELMAST